LLSPDEDFSPAGANSGIQYAESFKAYKTILSPGPEDPVFERIFSHFKKSLFGKKPAPSNAIVVDTGNYDVELEQLRNDLLVDSPVDGVANAGGDGTSPPPSPSTPYLQPDRQVSTSVTGAGTGGTPPSTPPLQPDRRVSISVTSHISHTIAASSQVSNIVHSSVNLSPELEVGETSPIEETPPPIQEKPRPAPRKKAVKSLKSAAATPDINADDAPARRVTRQMKALPVDPPPKGPPESASTYIKCCFSR
jgi:hypothetical protein